MTNLTDKQKELLSNPDVKDLILEFANWQIIGMDKGMLGRQLDSFASQFTVEPEWKILKYVRKDKYFSIEPHDYSPLCDAECTPHSVQYKSETLTVGDDTNCGVITGFKVVDNKMRVLWTGSVCHQWADISEVKKIEKYKTEDGVELNITNNSEVWYVKQDFSTDAIYLYAGFKPSIHYHHFSTKEKATEYILLNSPKLSVNECVNQVIGELNEWFYFTESPERFANFRREVQDKLLSLVKSKQ